MALFGGTFWSKHWQLFPTSSPLLHYYYLVPLVLIKLRRVLRRRWHFEVAFLGGTETAPRLRNGIPFLRFPFFRVVAISLFPLTNGWQKERS